MTDLMDKRPPLHGRVGDDEPPKRSRWRSRAVISLLALVLVVCIAVLMTGATAGLLPPPARVGRQPAAVSGGGPVLVGISSATGETQVGPGFAEVNGITYGMGNLWITGGDAKQNHVLYEVNPQTGQVERKFVLPSRLVINPGDVAVGAGAVWVAVGADVYRVDPARRGAVQVFAALPRGDLVGDLVVDAGAVWSTDTVNGRVYRFAAATGRLEGIVRIGTSAGDMAVGAGCIWVANAESRTISQISVTSDRVESVLRVAGLPSQIAASPGRLWVTDGTAGGVTVIDAVTHRRHVIRLGGEPTSLAAADGTMWAASTARGTVSRVNARDGTVMATVRVGDRPYAVAAAQQAAWVVTLGHPQMVHSSSTLREKSGGGGTLGWLERLCGL